MGFLPKVTVDIPGEAPKKSSDQRIDLARDRGPNDIVEGRERMSVRYLVDGKPVLTRWYDLTSGLPVHRQLRMPGNPEPVWTESYLSVQLDEAIDPATFAVPKD